MSNPAAVTAAPGLLQTAGAAISSGVSAVGQGFGHSVTWVATKGSALLSAIAALFASMLAYISSGVTASGSWLAANALGATLTGVAGVVIGVAVMYLITKRMAKTDEEKKEKPDVNPLQEPLDAATTRVKELQVQLDNMVTKASHDDTVSGLKSQIQELTRQLEEATKKKEAESST